MIPTPLTESWSKTFDKKFGGFYFYAKSGRFWHSSQKAGVKSVEVDFECKNAVGSDDIKEFIESLLIQQKEEIGKRAVTALNLALKDAILPEETWKKIASVNSILLSSPQSLEK